MLDRPQIGAHRARIVVVELEFRHVGMAGQDAAPKILRELIHKADLESIYIADPVYVEDTNDRVDIALFVGGFETATRFAALEKRVEKMKNKAVKKGSITEEDWKLITKSLFE